jgi:hypothetical protein
MHMVVRRSITLELEPLLNSRSVYIGKIINMTNILIRTQDKDKDMLALI